MDRENPIELGDDEAFVHPRLQFAKSQLPIATLHPLIELHEGSVRGAGHVLDIGEHHNDLRPKLRLNRLQQLFADLMDVEFVEDVSVQKIDAGDAVDLSHTDVR